MLKKVLNQCFPGIDRFGAFLIIVGALSWSLTMVKSGIVYSFGMGFWGPNGHDGIWHIALAKGLAQGSWQMPIFSGEIINNYHIGFDLILAMLSKLSFLSIGVLYFQILPPIFALLIGLFVYKFIYQWQIDRVKAYWTLFFIFFGGNFGWIVTLLRNGEFSGESIFWAQQAISTLVNPPFAMSLVFLFAGLFYLEKGLKSGDKKLLTLASFFFGILIQIKVYAGILVLLGLFASGFWRLFRNRRIDLIKVFTGTLIISILISPSSFLTGTKLIEYWPFWFLETMVQSPDRFYWPKMASAIFNYKLAGNFSKLFLAYGLTFFIFLACNFGTRIIGIWWFARDSWKELKRSDHLTIFILTVIFAGILIPSFFVQKGTPWNTIQFFYYSLVFSGVFAGISLGKLVKKIHVTLLYNSVTIIVVLLTVPTTIGTLLNNYLPARPPAKISNYELEALKFLVNQPNGVVLTQPFDKTEAEKALNNPPRPLYLYESTAYVSAISGKPTFMEDEVNLEITGYDWRERRKDIEPFFGETCQVDRNYLSENKISYIYLIRDNLCGLEFENVGEKIFENLEVEIYKIN